MKINFEKVKNYNQFLLSIAGTLGLLFLLFLGIMITVDECNFRFDDDTYNAGIISNVETENLLKDSIRKQIISFKYLNLIDSTNKVYLIPVGQSNLGEEEYAGDIFGLVNNFSGGKDYGDYPIMIDYNNLMIYDSKIDSSWIVFNNRISISDFRIIGSDNAKHLIIIGTDKDSNKDNYINYKDLQELFLYSLDKEVLTKIELEENFTTIGVDEQDKTKEIICRLGLDRNSNGKFNSHNEPIIYFKLDLEEKKLLQIIKNDQLNKLQNMLEGK
jgi:hypothetical protein